MAKRIFWALIIALFIITLAVVCTLYFRPLFYFDIGYLKLEASSGKTASEIRHAYNSLIDYMCVLNRAPLQIPGFAMSEHGRIHFADCKRIFDLFQIVCASCGILTIISMIVHRKDPHTGYLRLAGILTIAIPAVLGILAAVNWNMLFTTFHKVVFRNDYWLFDPTQDPVILILPDAFFLQCVVMIVVLILAGGSICLLIARRKARKMSRKKWRRR